MTALSSLDFTIERRTGIDVVVFANDSCRPAMETEVAMWSRLASSIKPITHVVVADTEEFGTVACGYSGSSDEIARAVMAKACAQGYSGSYQDRLAELGWRVEPVYLAVPPEVQTFQEGVSDWMAQCFVPSLYSNMTERGDRLLEEVLELLQAHGYDPSRVATLVDYVFNRPVGQPAQEVGGVMVTLAGYCWVAGLDMHAAGDTELVRITQPEVMAKIRAKQETKNSLHFDSPLPGQPAASADTALLDAVQRNHWKLAPVDLPTGLGDADVGWRVIEEDMSAPSGRRVVHEHATDDVRAALRYAIDATNSIAGED
ncbi:hypothetical protein [Stenotrophomonas sp. PS02298]|uniref:hypothetical protein n=1 Tax=Stenotrophomonas sp. PS02298 TaxID=2991424 RepID=UPI00249A37B7|nr:hypothetical protein [Stenotrophomonas sp. PS02298]